MIDGHAVHKVLRKGNEHIRNSSMKGKVCSKTKPNVHKQPFVTRVFFVKYPTGTHCLKGGR
jgi:hypothetical protein